MEVRESVAKNQARPVPMHQENNPMLSLTYHDTLYLVTELGVLGLVILLYWLTLRLDHDRPQL